MALSLAMDLTTSIRFPKQLRKKLDQASAKAHSERSDIVRVAVAQFLERHRTADQLITALIDARKQGL